MRITTLFNSKTFAVGGPGADDTETNGPCETPHLMLDVKQTGSRRPVHPRRSDQRVRSEREDNHRRDQRPRARRAQEGDDRPGVAPARSSGRRSAARDGDVRRRSDRRGDRTGSLADEGRERRPASTTGAARRPLRSRRTRRSARGSASARRQGRATQRREPEAPGSSVTTTTARHRAGGRPGSRLRRHGRRSRSRGCGRRPPVPDRRSSRTSSSSRPRRPAPRPSRPCCRRARARSERPRRRRSTRRSRARG